MTKEVRQFLGADGQPKYFMSEERAIAFLNKKRAGDTHKVELLGNKYTIMPIGFEALPEGIE